MLRYLSRVVSLVVLWLVLVQAVQNRLDYAPAWINSPVDHQFVRSASRGLHPGEASYRRDRRFREHQALRNFLVESRVDFDYTRYSSVIGLAFSGGGYRAMLSGAGQLAGLDRRSGYPQGGSLGGILQASSYITGLSGGSWLVGSLYFDNFPSIDQLLSKRSLWNLEKPLLATKRPGPFGNFAFLLELISELEKKKLAGFPITVTDLWGRALFRQLIDVNSQGPHLWSQLQNEKWFQERDAPYPIVVMNGRMPVYKRAHMNSPIYEVTPYELGTFDRDPHAFVDVKYLGTPLYNGKAVSESFAVEGIDNAGFILGASSSLFDQIIVEIVERLTTSETLADTVRKLLISLGVVELRDLAAVAPNPYLGYGHEDYLGEDDTPLSQALPYSCQGTTRAPVLYLADGGGNKQIIPIQPLLHPEREVDVIFAFDNGGTSLDNAWPDGSSLANTYIRQFIHPENPAFPHVPDSNSFVNLGLAMRPTFFGCYANNLTDLGPSPPPLVIYIPNQPFTFASNTSTFQLAYSRQQVLSMVNNGFNVATQGNGTVDEDWARCVACAVTQRSRERLGDPLSPKCQDCFSRYCWNGDIDSNEAKAKRNGRNRPFRMRYV